MNKYDGRRVSAYPHRGDMVITAACGRMRDVPQQQAILDNLSSHRRSRVRRGG